MKEMQQQQEPLAARRRSSLPLLRTKTDRPGQHNYTPPDTPTSPTSPSQNAPPELLFHNYLRAFHPFEPSPDDEASSITVPIKQGDLILVHSIHANGWADGTLLTTGTRGWLPTNYCEAYDHPYMRNLLNAMTQFWDLLGDDENASFSTFVRQDYIRGLIAGVRYLLEHTNCLHRGAALVLNHVGVRRMRKGLLADLSSMVQKAKELQEEASQPYAGEVIHIVLDELITKAFKVVTRAVKFVDIWMQETVNADEDNIPRREPPTPPVDVDDVEHDEEPLTPHSPNKRASAQMTPKKVEEQPAEQVTSSSSPRMRRKSAALRLSISSHRLSLVRESKTTGAMASEQLAQAHDECISLMGQFLGHHMQSRSPTELFENTQRLVSACERLVSIMDRVQPRANGRVVSMHQSQLVFQSELDDLVTSTKEVFTFSDHPEDEVVILPGQISRLVANGTRLIRAVGECVANTRRLLEKMGDFEVDTTLQADAQPPVPKDQDIVTPLTVVNTKALPIPPPARQRAYTTGAAHIKTEQTSPNTPSVPEIRTSLPPPTKYHRPLPRSPISPAAGDMPHAEMTPHTRKVSISETSTTIASASRDSGTTVASEASTRATTPDRQLEERGPIDVRMLTSFGSVSSMQSAATDASNEVDGTLLHKTFAHELVLNQQGQISRGSLPALVEQLTSHDSTPDPTFITGFYLTFRLFTDSRSLAQVLIDRFDYIGDSKTVGIPVRLRICNFLKGWLEGYWNLDADKDALGDIRYFAVHKVKPLLPSAGERLLEATRKVTAAYQSGVASPLVGKNNMLPSPIDDVSAPEPSVSKSQLSTLQRANTSTGECNIVDIDPLEIARQLTIMASRIYCAIQPEELLSLAWTKKDSVKAMNVRALSKLNTELSFLVNDTVLSQDEPKKRALVIKQWVKIANNCLTLHNYESLFAIVAALMCSHIARMKKTWEIVSKKTKARFEELKAVIDASGNNASLRRRIDETLAPCVPFLAICLGDMTFIDAGNPATRPLPNTASASGEPITAINFNKYAQMAKVVQLVKRFQVPYSLQTINELQKWLDTMLIRMTENPEELEKSFIARSHALEPRQVSVFPKPTDNSIRPVMVDERPKTAAGDDRDRKPESGGGMNFFTKHNAFGFKAVLNKSEPAVPALPQTHYVDAVEGAVEQA
ncbi:hypothetical protein AMS68_003785 [Peltaster fructicola]|uniref:Ras-GEF domain-containing protein n=1 Tax=Peltaster fructicola TaxID=286661 RepID=A0A6H0XUH9_9PEZI|nr:hypothetical protein AMS68_003785 [Peltaster fructicola]